ncbi:MAG: hypothetical protein LBV09_02225 [Deferribacteraceae bacterium]|jgi:exopolyphosphatase/guanosine-5'-triphosphate,3'-diphosphate pyrophosphatase|nr:hypothetical protein [Deferribacteraceae bacterium]
MKTERIGIINVGASAFRMYIGEYSGDSERSLDYLVKPLRIGTDTFTQGYIGLENVKKATEILKIFKLKLEEYGIHKYKALCTSGVREATNQDFFLDYTHLHSGIKLEVLDPSEEVYIKYVGVRNSVPGFSTLEQNGLVFANVSSGNVTLNITLKNKLLYAGTLPYGSLRMRQMFRSISHIKRHKAIEEYVRKMIVSVVATLDPEIKCSHLLGAGSSINLMLRLFKPSGNIITREQLEEIYARVRMMSLVELTEELGLRKDEASVLLPTIITYLQLMDIVKNDYFSFSRLTFPHTMSLYYSGRIKDTHLSSRIKNTLISIAEKYRADTKHARWVNYFARKFFDEFSDLHSLGRDSRVILEASVILHDVGKYVSDDALATNSYHIIKSLKIPGLDSKMLLMAAAVVYEGNKTFHEKEPQEYASMTSAERLTIRKLAGIMLISKALDMGNNRHITDIDIQMSDQIIVYARAEREPYLEMYTFDHQKLLFTETFGTAIELRARISYD